MGKRSAGSCTAATITRISGRGNLEGGYADFPGCSYQQCDDQCFFLGKAAAVGGNLRFLRNWMRLSIC